MGVPGLADLGEMGFVVAGDERLVVMVVVD
jgi:hypothetical protein